MPSPSPIPFLGQTNVSQPQLQHASDTQSVTASEDYYSLTSSSAYSDESQTALPPPIRRYQTPPSRYRTPMASGERLPQGGQELDQTRVPMRGAGRRRQSDADRTSYPNPLQSNPRQGAIGRKPVPSTVYEGNSPETIRGPIPNLAMSSAAKDDPPTPGIDDTPYIHFALDQLTRDEEVRGSRMYPGQQATPTAYRPDSQNTARPSYVSMSPDFDNRPGSRMGAVSPIDYTYGAASPRGGRSGAVSPLQADDVLDRQQEQQAVPPRNPARNHSHQGQSSQRPSTPEVFLAFDGPSGVPYMTLDALPTILSPLALIAFILVLSLFLTALVFAAVWSVINERLWEYTSFGDARYFIFQYLPTILAVLILLWLFEIQTALSRIAPFIALSSSSERMRSHATLLPLYPSTFALPNLVHFSAGLPSIGTFHLASWLSLFTVPLLATAFNVYQVNDIFSWLATQGVIWVVIALYIFLLISTIWVLLFLRRRSTGLKWDPTSLADFLVILEKSNVLEAYASHFSSNSDYDFREDIAARGDRLGYWRTNTRPNAAIHTLGAPGQPTRQYAVQDGQLVEQPSYRLSNQTDLDCQRFSAQTAKSLIPRAGLASGSYLPTFLRPIVVLGLAAILIILLVAFLVVSYLPATAIQSGFAPALPIPVNNAGFSAANFLYSFIPSLIGLLLFLLVQHQDLTIRRLQPIANLSNPDGSIAEHSLLLSYTSDPPFLVTLRALINRDFRVALLSLITLTSLALPVLAGGVFWAQFSVSDQSTLIYGDMPAFYALTAFFILACLSPLALPLTRKQAARYTIPAPACSRPNGKVNRFTTLVDIIALVHQSRLLTDAAFRAPASRTQLVTRLLAGQGYERISAMREVDVSDNRLAASPEQRGVKGAGASKVSLADSIRGYGEARAAGDGGAAGRVGGAEKQAGVAVGALGGEGRFKLGCYRGRDGKEYVGVDRAERVVGHEGTGKLVGRGEGMGEKV
ncbi:hypothetical protein KVT40_007537 [Elsinoe batatas]|uniref:Phosphoribosylaminoimidazole-succinocarboxamide synthase protein n=1 Tax=Elsinoe batatas TaxID=2601811 RepID=A0A8K0KWB1_9PEZI|nr:hypothetical protein KVT40_007537 [Elsinoe batatas]